MKRLFESIVQALPLRSSSLILSASMILTSARSQDLSKLYETLNPSVVVIHTLQVEPSPFGEDHKKGLGSGVLVDEEGLILTASHVVHTANAIIVEFLDGQKIEAEVVTTAPSADIALIKLMRKPLNPTVAKMGNSDLVKIGEQVFVIGAPLGLVHSLSSGHISGRHQRELIVGGSSKMEFLQTDAAINQGNSGGPMFNLSGEVIGIVSFILSKDGSYSGLGFAASMNMTQEILMKGTPFWSGFEGIYLSKETAQIFNVPQQSGILVQRVVSDSPADRIGLKGGKYKATIAGKEVWIGGDIILEIQGTSCDTPHNFDLIKDEIENLVPEVPFVIMVLRGGQIIELKAPEV